MDNPHLCYDNSQITHFCKIDSCDILFLNAVCSLCKFKHFLKGSIS